uniref:Uncharacterized protein n=1 Tax=Avena sativa TaxID=4498 RepID=A0ACD5W210_AVESA
MAAAAIRKRPAPGQDPRVHRGKKPRYAFGSIGDYEKLEVLGDGAYGVVIKAHDRRTITLEACCLAACHGHPSIIKIFDVATDAETWDFFLVMELVDGGRTLCEEIWKPLDEDVARRMMRLILDAAKKIHGVGIIHRDIKPENVLVSMFGALKVCDFGSTMRQKPAGVPYEECRVGTMIYTSPEQFAGNRYYGQAMDMWALGCVMDEILAGETLFVGKTEEDMVAEMSKLRDQINSTGKMDGLEFFDELSEAGREVLLGLLAFNPDERLTATEALQHRWFSEPSASVSQRYPGFVNLFS